MSHLRRLTALALLLFLFTGAAVPVSASSGPPEAAQPDTVSSWPELRDWLDAHKTVGGAVRLAADVYITDWYDYVNGMDPRLLKPVAVDCGAHTIFVDAGGEVTLSYTNYTLALRGEGGPQGLLCVLPGGQLGLDMLELDARSGSAVIQREGGVLTVDPNYPPQLSGGGGIAYAQQPVLLAPAQPSVPCYAVPEGAAGAGYALPVTVPVQINWKGQVAGPVPQPVVWDLQAVQADLEARRRTLVTGRWAGALAAAGLEHLQAQECAPFSSPQATLVFPIDGAALLEVSFRTGGGLVRVASLDFLAAPGLLTAQVLVSTDGGATWNPADEPHPEKTSEDGVYDATVYPDVPQAGSWFLVELIYPDGKVIHTDVVACEGAAARPVDYQDGHRGGGEPILPSASPPAVSGPAGNGAAPESGPAPEAPAVSSAPPDLAPSSSAGAFSALPGSLPAVDTPPAQGQTSLPAASTIVAHSQPAVQSRDYAGAASREPSSAASSRPAAPSAASSAAPAQGGAPASPGGTGRNPLPPAAQIALGIAMMAALATAALFLLNPQLFHKLMHAGNGKKNQK